MILKQKRQWLTMVELTGLLITYGCGHGYDGLYKAENSLEGSDDPVTLTNAVGAPSGMAPGDIFTITFDGDSDGRIDFSGTDSSAQFILSVSAIDGSAGGFRSVQLADENAQFEANIAAKKEDPAEWAQWSAGEALEQQMRSVELDLSLAKGMQLASPNVMAMGAMKTLIESSPVPSVGDVESLKVLSGISSLESYEDVEATVKCVGENVIFYVDTQVSKYNTSDLTDSDVKKLCADFDEVAGLEEGIFGKPSDVNGDGHVAVLMTPEVNRLGAMGGGIITGFFFASDLYAGTGSNHREIIYVMVPDSSGTYGIRIPKQFAMDNLLPAVLPHEFQHAISYNQKVFVSGGAAEEGWLNEGLSHLAEDLVGFGQENPSREEVFLDDPSSYGIVTTGSPGLAERGGIYLFLRFLYEQAGDGRKFIWDLINSDDTGVANLEAAFGATEEDFNQFSEFVLRWTSAIVMSSFNLSVDPKFSYLPRVENPRTGHYEGVCLKCDTEDGRGTILDGVALYPYYGVGQLNLETGSSEFYRIISFPQEISLAGTGGTYGATLIRFK